MRWIMCGVLIMGSGVGLFVYQSARSRPLHAMSLDSPDAAKTNSNETSRVFAAGIVEGLQSPLELRFETPGRIRTTRVREGDAVKMNDVLAEIATDTLDPQLTQAEAQWQIALAEREKWIKSRRGSGNSSPFASADQSAQDGIQQQAWSVPPISKEDQIIAEARVNAAESVVKYERVLLNKTRLRAPMDGIILAMNLKEGDTVGPSSESGTITMVNRETTRIRAFVEEMDAMEVATGQDATAVASAQVNRTYRGKVISCSPYVCPKSHRHLNPGERLDVRVRIVIVELDDGADLLIGLPVEVFIDIDAPNIPSQSIRRTGSGKRRRGTATHRANSTTGRP